MTTTWKALIEAEMREHSGSWADIISSTMTDDEATTKFDDGYGGSEGIEFTVWTANRVYFPVVYDGAEWCNSARRWPDGKPTPHIGGQ